MASRMCSAETYSSLNFSASSKAFSRTWLVASPRYCCETPRHFGQARKLCLDLGGKRFRPHTQAAEQRRHDAVLLRHQRGQKVQRLELLLAVFFRNVLRGLQRLLSFYREFVVSQHYGFLSSRRLMLLEDGGGRTDRPPLRPRQLTSYLPFAETPILICFGLDSSRFGMCTVKTPF